LPKTLLLTVKAIDEDTGDFGKVTYRIVGEGSDVFTIHPEDGHIQVLIKATLKKSVWIKFLYLSSICLSPQTTPSVLKLEG